MLLIVVGVSSACGAGLPPAAAGGTGASGGVGGVGGDASGGALSLPPPVTSLPAEQACMTGSAGPRLMRRLTADEFAATMGDLFGDANVPTATIFNDAPVLGFGVDSGSLVVQGLTGQQLMDNAETVAHWAVTNHLAQLAPCSTTDPTCARTFIESFGRRAFRAPLSPTRIQDYAQLFSAEASFAGGVEAVVGAMLQSPYFLYRRELGSPATSTTTAPVTTIPASEVALLPHEIASELSYLLLGSMPDETLLAAAENGGLATASGIDQQFDRLLADPRSADAIMRFARGWLELDRLNTTVKDDTVFLLTDSLRQSMANETRGLFLEIFNSGGGFAELVTADHSYLDASLAQFYGLPTAGLGSTPVRVDYPVSAGGRDRGLLAHATLLVGHAKGSESSPTQRGHMVRERLLCLPVPPMPTNLDTALKPATGAQTTRQHYEVHSTNDPCRACHVLMDPIGFGFEHYDSFGRYRDRDNNVPVDATGTLNGVKEGSVAFDGLSGLAAYLAGSDAARTCVARYWAYVAYGAPTWVEDACTYAAIRSEAATHNLSFASVLKAIVHTPHFTRRAASP